jgi:RNAse (barnase) inhibitor barstar
MSPASALPAGFCFTESPAAFRDDTAIVVRLPKGIRSKQKLLNVLAGRLRFPRYFGHNWDALEDCLRDLSWLPGGRPVIIVQEDLPFGERSENRRTYVAILRSAAQSALPDGRVLSIVWPAAMRDQVSPPAIDLR